MANEVAFPIIPIIGYWAILRLWYNDSSKILQNTKFLPTPHLKRDNTLIMCNILKFKPHWQPHSEVTQRSLRPHSFFRSWGYKVIRLTICKRSDLKSWAYEVWVRYLGLTSLGASPVFIGYREWWSEVSAKNKKILLPHYLTDESFENELNKIGSSKRHSMHNVSECAIQWKRSIQGIFTRCLKKNFFLT